MTTISTLSTESKEQFLQAVRACVWFVPLHSTEQVARLEYFSVTDFESAMQEIIEQHHDISESADSPDERDVVLELEAYLAGRSFDQVLSQLLGVVQGEPPFDDLLVQVKSLTNAGLCCDCVAEQVYRAYLARRSKADRLATSTAGLPAAA